MREGWQLAAPARSSGRQAVPALAPPTHIASQPLCCTSHLRPQVPHQGAGLRQRPGEVRAVHMQAAAAAAAQLLFSVRRQRPPASCCLTAAILAPICRWWKTYSSRKMADSEEYTGGDPAPTPQGLSASTHCWCRYPAAAASYAWLMCCHTITPLGSNPSEPPHPLQLMPWCTIRNTCRTAPQPRQHPPPIEQQRRRRRGTLAGMQSNSHNG